MLVESMKDWFLKRHPVYADTEITGGTLVPPSSILEGNNMASKNKIIKHLKGDIKTFKKEASEDVALIKSMKKKKKNKVSKVMEEYKEGKLHSGSKKGPKVTSRKQAIAIGLSEAREAGEHIKKKRKKPSK